MRKPNARPRNSVTTNRSISEVSAYLPTKKEKGQKKNKSETQFTKPIFHKTKCIKRGEEKKH